MPDAGFIEFETAKPDRWRALWSELAELGVMAACTPDGEGGALEICAAMESLGAAVFPGPLPATFLAGQVLDGDERSKVVTGEWKVSLGTPPLMPWPDEAQIFLEIDRGQRQEAVDRRQVEDPAPRCEEPVGPALVGDLQIVVQVRFMFRASDDRDRRAERDRFETVTHVEAETPRAVRREHLHP